MIRLATVITSEEIKHQTVEETDRLGEQHNGPFQKCNGILDLDSRSECVMVV